MRLLIVLLTLMSSCCFGSELKKSSDVGLAHILTSMEVLYTSKDFPIVQVIQSWEEVSECDGPYQSCPNARLFITSTMGDLGEDPMLYELPKSKGWKVVQVRDTKNEMVITLKTTLDHANVSQQSRKSWRSKTYVIKVSKYTGIATQEEPSVTK